MTALAERYRIDNFIDTFALGHYARVLEAYDAESDQVVAFKVLRPEHLSADRTIRWEYRAFSNEARLLTHLAENPHVVDMLDCGYISTLGEAPAGGEIESFGRDVDAYAEAITDFADRGWRPYLTMANLPRSNNLFYLMKPNNQGSRWRMPTEEGLALAVQFGKLLQFAHRKHIAYLDHKLEHVYWDGTKLELIDLNSSRQLNNGNGDSSMYRMDIHNLCVGILYSVFTGLSPQQTTLRPQPSNQQEVEARYRDVTRLDFGVEPSLSPALQELLQHGAAMEIDSADEFLTGLQVVCAHHGWDFPSQYTSPASREARDKMRAGLHLVREGQEKLRESRDLFRDAAVLDDITEDLEAELRRLVKSANDMLNKRVIP
jgi:serine/threonine protein kinase